MSLVVERQSSSTSTDSGLHLQEKVKVDWPFKNLSMSIFVTHYFDASNNNNLN